MDAYLRTGPVFRVRALNQGFVIMAGAAANRFLLERGEAAFTSEESFGGLDREFGMRVHVLRGRPHRHLRGLLAAGLSRDLLAARWDSVTAETQRMLDGWADRPALPVVDACQRLAAAQLSIAYTGAGSARTAAGPFDVEGHRVERGQRVLVATCVTHQLPEHFPDPHRFDLDRDFTAGRKAAVYAPSSVGGHTCLGAGMTQVLAVATVALLARRLRLTPTRPGRPLRITATPGPNPGKRFTVSVARRPVPAP